MQIKLVDRFVFAHEPRALPGADPGSLAARREELDEFTARILFSRGGAFLVTGYRGVGKTTFVNQLVRTLRERMAEGGAGRAELLEVHLSLARHMTAGELMHHVLRGLFAELRRRGLLDRIDADVRKDLELAFLRTSMTVGLNTGEESSRSFELGKVPLGLPLFGQAGLTIGRQRTRSSRRELTYLAYDDKAAEQDIVRISRELSAGYERGPLLLRRLARLCGRRVRRVPLKILFIFDELDKLEHGEPGAAAASPLDEILRSLKTLLTTSGITFLFVAGRDLYDRWLADISRGDSIYESIFAHVRYLPALWSHVGELCDPLVDQGFLADEAVGRSREHYEDFKNFLSFKGRGIPRRILRGFHEAVRWDGTSIALSFSNDDVRRYRFYSHLYRVLCRHENRLFGEPGSDLDVERLDQQRLATYYLTDWILKRGARKFSPEDALRASLHLSRLIAPTDDVAPSIVDALLGVLYEHDFLEQVAGDSVVKLVSGTQEKAQVWYRVPRRCLIEMGQVSDFFEREADALVQEDVPALVLGRYEVLTEVGRGGSGVVYKGLDRQLGKKVAIKRLHPHLLHSENARRFVKEVEILRRLDHPGVVRLYDADAQGSEPFLVMDFVEGLPLDEVAPPDGGLAPEAVVEIARGLAGALAYVHDQGVLWRDAKPSNAFLTNAGRVVIIDFGISQFLGVETTQTVIGTPKFMSPEQVKGELLDPRSDIFSVGAILYELLTRASPFGPAEDITEWVYRLLYRPVLPPSELAAVPQDLERVILKCLEKDREARFGSVPELLAALPPSRGDVDLRQLATEALARREARERRERIATAVSPQRTGTLATGAAAAVPRSVTRRLTVPELTPRRPCLVLESGAGRREITLAADAMRIGRSQDNDIVLEDGAASRYHALLEKKAEGYSIAELNTSNGLFVNGSRLQGARLLSDGDRIKIGATELVYLA